MNRRGFIDRQRKGLVGWRKKKIDALASLADVFKKNEKRENKTASVYRLIRGGSARMWYLFQASGI